MTNRRRFLQIGITATAWPLASTAARAAGAAVGTRAPLELYKIVYDKRFSQSIEFGRRAEAIGLAALDIEGDMTSFWYDELYLRWKERPQAIAGLTAHGPMFCFEQLAHDYGMRVVFRATHAIQPHGGIVHALTGPLSMLNDAVRIDGDSDWGAKMAETVAHCPSGRNEIGTSSAACAATENFGHDADALYSWIIAPAVKEA